MLSGEAEWVWDSWYVVDGNELHAFYLMAPKSLGDSSLRHFNARVGHSVSTNGRDWEHLPDAFGPSEVGFDNLAIWTGSIVKHEGLWHMFYTGVNKETRERVQAIGHATSHDLMTWDRVSDEPILRADNRYGLLGNSHDGCEHFRDPWVFKHDGMWHMTVTATTPDGWGTVAHATSHDLHEWMLQAPLVHDSKLKQLEVTEVVQVDGAWQLIFCMTPTDVLREGAPVGFGTFSAPAESPTGPFDLDKLSLFGDQVYAGRVVQFNGEWLLLGFGGTGAEEDFSGVIVDPIAVEVSPRHNLQQVKV